MEVSEKNSEKTHTCSAESKEKLLQEVGQDLIEKFKNAETNTNYQKQLKKTPSTSTTATYSQNPPNNNVTIIIHLNITNFISQQIKMPLNPFDMQFNNNGFQNDLISVFNNSNNFGPQGNFSQLFPMNNFPQNPGFFPPNMVSYQQQQNYMNQDPMNAQNFERLMQNNFNKNPGFQQNSPMLFTNQQNPQFPNPTNNNNNNMNQNESWRNQKYNRNNQNNNNMNMNNNMSNLNTNVNNNNMVNNNNNNSMNSNLSNNMNNNNMNNQKRDKNNRTPNSGGYNYFNNPSQNKMNNPPNMSPLNNSMSNNMANMPPNLPPNMKNNINPNISNNNNNNPMIFPGFQNNPGLNIQNSGGCFIYNFLIKIKNIIKIV